MHSRLWCALALALVKFSIQSNALRPASRFPASRSFLLYRTNVINQKACKCSTLFSCSCCETVTIIYTKMQKRLCSNFTYQRNGLNVDISLGTDTIKTTTVTNYRPFKLCANIPGSIFSSICVNVIELNQYSRSLTACVRHEIRSKAQEWQINYSCLGISTFLPIISPMSSASAIIIMTTGAMTATSGMTMKPAMNTNGMATTTKTAMNGATTTKTAMNGVTTMKTAMNGATTMKPAMNGAMTTKPAMNGAMTTKPAMNGAMTTKPAMNGATTTKPAMNGAMTTKPAMNGATTTKPAMNGTMMKRPPPPMMNGNQTLNGIEPKRNIRKRALEQIRSLRLDSSSPENSRAEKSFDDRKKRFDRSIFTFRNIHRGNGHENNRRVGIVYGKPISRLELATMAPEVNRTLSSGRKVEIIKADNVVTEVANITKIIVDFTVMPMQFPPLTLYDRSQNFPSRIPPVVASALKEENAGNSNTGVIIFRGDTSNTFLRNTTDPLIFPN